MISIEVILAGGLDQGQIEIYAIIDNLATVRAFSPGEKIHRPCTLRYFEVEMIWALVTVR